MIKDSKQLIITGIVIIVIVAGVSAYLIKSKNDTSQGNLLSPQEAAEKAINYINQYLLEEGVIASLIEVVEDNGLYKFKLKVLEKEHSSYVTKDGKLLFIGGFDMDQNLETLQPETSVEQPEKLTCEDIKKTERPLLEAFVVSECPFGIQMQRILNEIVKNIPSLVNNIEIKYMGSVQGDKITSMHGDKEAQENLRQICLREEQLDKYWSYIDCHIKKGDVENCLVAINVDMNKLNTCINDNSKGLKYAREDFTVQDKYNDTPECKKCMKNPPPTGCSNQCSVTGSPALILNDQGQPEGVSEFNFGGRTAEAVKTLLCCGFKTESDICFQKLAETSAATGFSETYSQSSGSSGGSCE